MLVEIYNVLPPELWAVIAAPVVVIIVNALKRLLGDTKTDIVIHFLTAATATLVTYLPTVIAHTAKPPEFIAAYAGAIFTVANILYAGSKYALPVVAALKARYEADKTEQAPAATKKTVPVVAETAQDVEW